MNESPKSRVHFGKFSGLKQLIRRLPATISATFKGTTAGITASNRLREERVDLSWDEVAAKSVSNEIEDLIRRGLSLRKKEELTVSEDPSTLSQDDLILFNEIADITQRNNVSNLSRTSAYLECYNAYPELHWALLAHLVSRNAGWNMTDLKGGQLGNMLSEEDKQATYRLLERSNALIFQDAYPQLLLYMKSRELSTSLFHLLPYFHVSRFMIPFWNRFWLERNSSLLAVGLIINEQNYIEHRVVKHPYYQKYVTDKANFHLHDWAGLNQIVFPLLPANAPFSQVLYNNHTSSISTDERRDLILSTQLYTPLKLAGRVLTHFGSLSERISFGKNLYALLFSYAAVREGAEQFATQVPHTGSRSDYWPHLFTTDQLEAASTDKYQESELLEEESLPPELRLYSPKLLDVWNDTPYEPITKEDWLVRNRDILDISAPKPPYLCDISHEHRLGIMKIALARDFVDH